MLAFPDRDTLLPRTSLDYLVLELGCSYQSAYEGVLFLAGL